MLARRQTRLAIERIGRFTIVNRIWRCPNATVSRKIAVRADAVDDRSEAARHRTRDMPQSFG